MKKNIKYVKAPNVFSDDFDSFEEKLKEVGFQFISPFGDSVRALREMEKLSARCWVVSITDQSFVRSKTNYGHTEMTTRDFEKSYIAPFKFGL